MNNMIKTTEKQITYLGINYTRYSTYFVRRSSEKTLMEATKWMKEHSKTFMGFIFQTCEFETGNYVAKHSDNYVNSSGHYNGDCVVYPTESGKSWCASLKVRR